MWFGWTERVLCLSHRLSCDLPRRLSSASQTVVTDILLAVTDALILEAAREAHHEAAPHKGGAAPKPVLKSATAPQGPAQQQPPATPAAAVASTPAALRPTGVGRGLGGLVTYGSDEEEGGAESGDKAESDDDLGEGSSNAAFPVKSGRRIHFGGEDVRVMTPPPDDHAGAGSLVRLSDGAGAWRAAAGRRGAAWEVQGRRCGCVC